MSDLATLGLHFETKGADEAARHLDAISAKAEKAEASVQSTRKATDALSDSQRRGATATGKMESELVKAVAAQQAVTQSTNRLTASQELMNNALSGQGRAVSALRPAIVGLVGAFAPLLPLIGPLVIVTGALTLAWLDGEKSVLGYEKAVAGVGRTAGLTAIQLRELTVAGAEQGKVSIRSAQEQSAAYLATGRIGGAVLGDLIAIGKDYASFMGVDAPTATRQLAKAMEAPDKAGREMTRTFGLLTQAQLEQIDAAMKAGDQLKAQQILMEGMKGAIEGHAENVGQITNAWDAVKRSISDAITKFGEWMYITDTEKLAKYDTSISNAQRTGGQPQIVARMQQERQELAFAIGYRNAARENAARSAAANQAAQTVVDNQEKVRTARVAATKSISEEERAYQQLMASTGRYLEGLESERSALGKTESQLLRAEAAAQAKLLIDKGATAEALARADAIMKAADALDRERQALEQSEEAKKAADKAAADQAKQLSSLTDMVTQLERQREAIGKTPEDLARLNAEWAIADLALGERTPEMERLIAKILEMAPANEIAANAARALLDELRLIDDLARDAGQGMADAFGNAGRALGDLLTAMTGYREQREAINQADLTDAQKSREQAALEIRTYGDMASAAKGFFDEKSAGYRALQAVEQVYRAIQFANAVKAMVLDKTETGATVLQSGIKAAAHGVVAVAKAIASMPFPLNIAAGAATAAALVGFGVKMFGGGGGSSAAPALPETNTGTGSVLGDPSVQSQSINKSMELAEKYYNRDLSYSNDMLDALRAIEKGIGDVTTAIARQLGIGGKLSTDGLGLGSTSNPGFLGMFSSSRSSELADQGLNFGGQNLGQIISNGIAGSFYQIVQNTKTKSGFFGIGGGTSTWNTETSSGIDAGLSRDIANLLASLKSGVLSAAGKLGIEGAEAVLNAFQVNIGRISFKDMSSAEIAETLTAVFSAVGDQMAGAIMPTLTKYQAAGEGLMETLTRLAAQYQAVDQVMASLGMTFGAVGVGSIEARDRLVQLAGGLDEFVKSSTFFAEEFLTEAQRMGPIQSAVNAELARLGIATDITREQFANLVMGLDVSTESGAAMYAALMRLAPGLDKVLDYTEGLNGVIVDTAALLQQRQTLEIQLMEAQGRSAEALAAKRVLELAAMDASLRPLQEAIWAAQEAASAQAELARAQQEAADVARQIASQRRNLEIDLMSATGDVAGALAAKRADELAAMHASLRPLQQAIWTAQEAAAAQAELARAQQEAADIARQIASQRRDLEIELMEATGNSAGALAARRADELAAIDASLRPIKEAIWAAQDLAAAQAEATRAAEEATRAYEQQRQAMLDLVETARNDLTQAYQREAAALQETIDKFGGFSDSLRAFRKELDQIGSGSASYASTKAEFDRVAALARLGDAEALGGLQGVSKTFLDAAMSNASSQQAYLRDLALVKSAVDLAADTADRTKTAAERQLEALNASVAGLITLNESVLSVRDAIGALQEAMRLAGAYGITKFARGGVFTTPTYFDIGQMAEAGPEAIMPLHQGPNGLGVRAVNDNGSVDALLAEVRALRGEIAELKAAGVQTAVNTGQIKRQIDRQEVDGVYVRGEAPGDPVDVENAA